MKSSDEKLMKEKISFNAGFSYFSSAVGNIQTLDIA